MAGRTVREAAMKNGTIISNALLWAAALLASALLDAPRPLTLLVLPALAAVALIHAATRKPARRCLPRRGAA